MLLLNTSPKELGLELVRVLFVGLVIGILGGLAANLFVLGVGAIDGLIREQMVGQSALSGGLIRWAALIAGAFGIYGLKQAFRMDRWHGPADAILGAHRPDAPFPAREGFISTTAAFVSASAGASVGQYGPVLHFGASVGAQVRALFPTRLTPDIYVACGVAAAISAGFGAPIAAVVLVSEAILRHFAVRAVAPITVSAIVATAVTPLFFDRQSPYSVTASSTDWGLIPVVLGLGACAALLAIVFMRSLLRTAAWAKARNNDLAMLLLAATLMAMIGMLVPEAVGLGTQSVNDLLAGEKLVGEAALMLVAKSVPMKFGREKSNPKEVTRRAVPFREITRARRTLLILLLPLQPRSFLIFATRPIRSFRLQRRSYIRPPLFLSTPSLRRIKKIRGRHFSPISLLKTPPRLES